MGMESLQLSMQQMMQDLEMMKSSTRTEYLEQATE